MTSAHRARNAVIVLGLLVVVVTAAATAQASPPAASDSSTAAAPAPTPSAAAQPVAPAALSAPAPAPAPPSASPAPEADAAIALERARAAYEYGDMEMVVDSARVVAEGRAHPSPAQRVQALRLLGIGLFLTGRPEGAETAFFDLLRQRPEAKLDPTHTRPDVVAFFETVRSHHSEEIRQAAERSRPSKHLLLAFLPPVGQFQNGDRARGFTLAAFEVMSLGLAIGTYVQLKKWVKESNQTFGTHTQDAQTLKVVNNVAVGLFAASVIYGVVDALANFSHHDEEPPLASISPSGLTLRF
jgi:hypothetical protein